MQTGEFEKAWDVKKAVENQEITINDDIVANPDYQLKPNKDIVKYNNKQLKPTRKLYYVMNKPAGYVCQKSSKELTIYDLFKKIKISDRERNSLFAVGRLDKNTEGLIIITNDGNYSNQLMQPGKEKEKTYFVIVKEPISYEEIKLLTKGVKIFIDDKPYTTKPCKIEPINDTRFRIILTEGKKNQIRKMVKTADNEVIALKREAIGDIKLNNLKSGEARILER